MNTNSYRTAAGVVTGARHLRAGRNGQDAVTTIVEGDVAVAVVCDGCSAGSSSEVGARLGARWFARAVADRLAAGASVTDPATWAAARVELAVTVRMLAAVAPQIVKGAATSAGMATAIGAAVAFDGGVGAAAGLAFAAPVVGVGSTDVGGAVAAPVGVGGAIAAIGSSRVADTLAIRDDSIDRSALHDLFLFTVVAAAMTRDGAAVWALGDGAYAIDGDTRELGPFANNEPPYLAYDLVGDARPAHLDVRGPEVRTIVVATDGALELAGAELDLGALAAPRYLAHPDALRRQLAVLARGEERIDWDAQRVVRAPAVLQDDCGVAILQRARELA